MILHTYILVQVPHIGTGIVSIGFKITIAISNGHKPAVRYSPVGRIAEGGRGYFFLYIGIRCRGNRHRSGCIRHAVNTQTAEAVSGNNNVQEVAGNICIWRSEVIPGRQYSNTAQCLFNRAQQNHFRIGLHPVATLGDHVLRHANRFIRINDTGCIIPAGVEFIITVVHQGTQGQVRTINRYHGGGIFYKYPENIKSPVFKWSRDIMLSPGNQGEHLLVEIIS